MSSCCNFPSCLALQTKQGPNTSHFSPKSFPSSERENRRSFRQQLRLWSTRMRFSTCSSQMYLSERGKVNWNIWNDEWWETDWSVVHSPEGFKWWIVEGFASQGFEFRTDVLLVLQWDSTFLGRQEFLSVSARSWNKAWTISKGTNLGDSYFGQMESSGKKLYSRPEWGQAGNFNTV